MMNASVVRDVRHDVEAELAARICVRPPYFALRDASWNGQEFSAVASSEFSPAPLELGPMRAAELGRHGAIAGLCALAMSQTDSARRYYLASAAHYTGCFSRAKHGSLLGFTSRVESLTKRSGRSTVTATTLDSAETVMKLTVDYLVLSEAMFERLYRDHRQPTEVADRLRLADAERTSVGVRTISSIPAWLCAGHFDSFPALPLAVVVRELAEMSGELLGRPHWVRDAQVSARDLCWAGQSVRFESAREAGPTDDETSSAYSCRAIGGSSPFAEMKLILSLPP